MDALIPTPDHRVRVFVSSTLGELAEERQAARTAVTRLRLTPVMFELGARPHPPRELYRAYLAQSDVFVGIYWQHYGWIAPGEDVSGLEDEYALAGDRPKLIYVKEPAPDREPRLAELLLRVEADDRASYRPFRDAGELAEVLADDLAVLLTERFDAGRASPEDLRPSVLPVPPTPIVGRQADVEELCALLRRRDVRLVTVLGPGGIGKTRVALETATALREDFDGVWFVDLSAVTDPALVPATVAAVLGVTPEGTRPVFEVLAARLAGRGRVLLVLDNFEQVVAAAGALAQLLAGSPTISLLVTSRTLLRLRGEHEYSLAPLVDADAVALFVARAQEVHPDFELTAENAAAVAEICRRLDGIPLAIELAAARVLLLSPAALLRRLGDRLDLPGGQVDLPQRQRTLRATIDWSHSLLSADERALLARLSVCVGGCTLEAAEVVGAVGGDLDVLDVLSSLVAQSLIAPGERQEGEPRFRMLETVREYAGERLDERGEADAAQRRMVSYLRAFGERAGQGLMGPENRTWLARIDGELDNLRAALRWAIDSDEAELAVRLAAPIATYWWTRSLLAEVLGYADQTAALPSAARLPADAHALLVWCQGVLRIAMGRLAEAAPFQRELTDAARALGDDHLLAHARYGLALTLSYEGSADEMRALLSEGLDIFRRLDDPWGVAYVLIPLGELALRDGDTARAFDLHREALANAERIDNDQLRGVALNHLGLDALLTGDVPGARAHLAAAAEVHRHLFDQEGLAYCLDGLAGVAFATGHPEDAARLLGTSTHVRDLVGIAVWPLLRPLADAMRAALEQTLGPDAFTRALAAGAAQRPTDALTYALDLTA